MIAEAVTRRIATARLTINARTLGAGPPLLYLGGSAFDLGLRAPVFASPLAARHAIAAADPRGLGLTDQPEGAWTMEDYALDALALMDALGWDRAHVLGESFGGMVALHLAGMAPGRVARLAVAVAAPGGPGGRSYPIHELQGIADPAERAARTLALQDRRFAAMPPETRAARIADRVRADRAFAAHEANAAGHPRLLATRAAHDARHLLPAIAAPTLVLSGRHDDQSPLALSQALVQSLPDARLAVIEGGHGLLFAEAAAMDAVLAHFAGQGGLSLPPRA